MTGSPVRAPQSTPLPPLLETDQVGAIDSLTIIRRLKLNCVQVVCLLYPVRVVARVDYRDRLHEAAPDGQVVAEACRGARQGGWPAR